MKAGWYRETTSTATEQTKVTNQAGTRDRRTVHPNSERGAGLRSTLQSVPREVLEWAMFMTVQEEKRLDCPEGEFFLRNVSQAEPETQKRKSICSGAGVL